MSALTGGWIALILGGGFLAACTLWLLGLLVWEAIHDTEGARMLLLVLALIASIFAVFYGLGEVSS